MVVDMPLNPTTQSMERGDLYSDEYKEEPNNKFTNYTSINDIH